MKLIAELLQAAIAELLEKGVPGIDDDMQTFEAIAVIDIRDSIPTVTICGWMIFLWLLDGTWQAYWALEDV